MAFTYSVLYSDLSLETPKVFNTYLSVNFGTLYSSLDASASFGPSQINTALLAAGYKVHETCSSILYVQPMLSRDGTVMPCFSGTWNSNGYWTGSTTAYNGFLKASLTGSIYDEETDLSAVGKTAYILVGCKR